MTMRLLLGTTLLLLTAVAGSFFYWQAIHIYSRLLPGSALATYIGPGKGRLQQLTLHLTHPPKEGRLRVLLAPAQPGKFAGWVPASGQTLGPALEFTAAQLAAAPGGDVTIPVPPLPPASFGHDGFFLVVECLPTHPADSLLGVTVTSPPGQRPYCLVVLQRAGATACRVLPESGFPTLAAEPAPAGPARSFVANHARGPWLTHSPAPYLLRYAAQWNPR